MEVLQLDDAISSWGLSTISQMKVVEDFKSRPREAVSSVVETEKEVQEWNEQKLPKVLPGYSGGRLPGRSTKEKGREEGEVDARTVEKEELGAKSPKKWLRASRERRVRKMMATQSLKEELGKGSCEIGTAHKSKMKKRRRVGKKGRWQHSGMKSKNWRRPWNEEGWKEALCS